MERPWRVPDRAPMPARTAGAPAGFSMRGFSFGEVNVLYNGISTGPQSITSRTMDTAGLAQVAPVHQRHRHGVHVCRLEPVRRMSGLVRGDHRHRRRAQSKALGPGPP